MISAVPVCTASSLSCKKATPELSSIFRVKLIIKYSKAVASPGSYTDLL